LYPLGNTLPSRQQVSRLFYYAHGITGTRNAGPTPSAGGLQALELYLAVLEPGWLPSGIYHFDRACFYLSQITQNSTRGDLELLVPSLQQVQGGAVLWLLVGDAARVRAKYSERGIRFLLLEAGHLMQDICLLSISLGLLTIPLGGFFEHELSRLMHLPDTDMVLYAGLCGQRP
jgi:SagB-type dehydrogenase family enzyme